MITVKQVFDKAYGEIPEGSSRHTGEYSNPFYAKEGKLFRYDYKDCGWEKAPLYKTTSPDISDRDGNAFRGFFGDKYDLALDELTSKENKYMTIQELLNKSAQCDKLMQYVDWNKVSRHFDHTEEFMREFQDHLDWEIISAQNTLSEDFIREMENKVDWNEISMREDLDEDFIREFQDRVNWCYVSDSVWEDLSPEFRKKFEHRLVGK